MINALEHHRTRLPGAVNPLLTSGILYYHTTHGAGWSMAFDKGSGGLGQLWIDYGDGSAPELKNASEGFNHDYTDNSDKTVKVWTPDGWDDLHQLWINGHDNCGMLSGFSEITGLNGTFDCSYNALTGNLPNLSKSPGLQLYIANGNLFSGPVPDQSVLTSLVQVHIEDNPSLSGSLPSYAACVLLQNFFATNTGISGTLPTFAACTALLQFIMNNCPGITTYTNGCFSTQKYMTDLQLNGCSFPAASINAILANLRTSSAISGRVGCSVDLSGSGMSAPTGQGITDKTYLNGLSGWSVSTE